MASGCRSQNSGKQCTDTEQTAEDSKDSRNAEIPVDLSSCGFAQNFIFGSDSNKSSISPERLLLTHSKLYADDRIGDNEKYNCQINGQIAGSRLKE